MELRSTHLLGMHYLPNDQRKFTVHEHDTLGDLQLDWGQGEWRCCNVEISDEAQPLNNKDNQVRQAPAQLVEPEPVDVDTPATIYGTVSPVPRRNKQAQETSDPLEPMGSMVESNKEQETVHQDIPLIEVNLI